MDISLAHSILGSRIKVMEVLGVCERIKPSARLLCKEGKLSSTLSFLKHNGLIAFQSNFKVLKDHSQGIYVDRSLKVESDDARLGYVVLYVSLDVEPAREAKSLEKRQKHAELGMVLGYPKCCCEFFEEKYDKFNTDLTLDTLKNSQGFEFPFHTNIAARHFDAALLSHFPCSFSCKQSIAIGKRNVEMMGKYAPQIAAEMIAMLKSPIVYTNKGVFIFRDHKQDGNKISFKGILPTSNSKLSYYLSEEKKFTIINKNKIIIGKETIEGGDSGVMVFQ